MSAVLMSAAFLFSAILLPWWVTVPLGIFLLARFKAYMLVIFGGILMDILFSSPQPALFGFSYIYTLLFVVLASIAFYLQDAMLE